MTALTEQITELTQATTELLNAVSLLGQFGGS